MKSSIAPSCAATSVPVETTLNSLMCSLIPGWSAKALAVLTIWMRHVLPTNPLTNAILYGPCFFGHWKYFVLASQGLKHSGFAPGPETTFGPANAPDALNRPASARADTRPTCFIAVSSLSPARSYASDFRFDCALFTACIEPAEPGVRIDPGPARMVAPIRGCVRVC